jgi:hypothetical protein
LGGAVGAFDLGLDEAADTEDDATVGDWMQRSGGRRPGPPSLEENERAAVAPTPIDTEGTPLLRCEMEHGRVRVPQGGGGVATLNIWNEGDATLTIRMIATQHPWLNVRPLELPLVIPPGKGVRVDFAISAARLSPGEYRSEVYLSANASAQSAEDLRGGWFKHTAEIRVTVDGPGAFSPPGSGSGSRPHLPAGGTGCLLALPGALLRLAFNGALARRPQPIR